MGEWEMDIFIFFKLTKKEKKKREYWVDTLDAKRSAEGPCVSERPVSRRTMFQLLDLCQ